MSIQEEITALLNGELTGGPRVAELMHVLAVSPEKRQLLIEQIRMGRAYGAMAATTVPSHAADARIFAGLAAVDAELAPLPPAVIPVAGAGLLGRLGLGTFVAALLLTLGIGGGYVLGARYATSVAPRLAGDTAGTNATFLQLAMAQDSLDATHARLEGLSEIHDRTLADLTESRSRQKEQTEKLTELTSRVKELQASLDKARRTPVYVMLPAVDAPAAKASVPPMTIGRDSVRFIVSPPAVTAPIVPTTAVAEEKAGPWEFGLRNNLAHSLPRIYGVQSTRTVLTDKELAASYRIGERGEGFGKTIRLGVAAGEVEFRQRIPINRVKYTDQTPTLFYGRGFVSTELFNFLGHVGTASIELGAGGTITGAFGTAGLDFEIRPSDRLSLHVGGSAWQLHSSYNSQSVISTNLNFHYGFGISF